MPRFGVTAIRGTRENEPTWRQMPPVTFVLLSELLLEILCPPLSGGPKDSKEPKESRLSADLF